MYYISRYPAEKSKNPDGTFSGSVRLKNKTGSIMILQSDKIEAFVFRHFDAGRFGPEAGLARFRKRMGISGRAVRRPGSIFHRVAIPAAAMLVLSAGTGIYMHQRNAWTEFHAYDVAQTFVLKDATQVTLAPGAALRYQPKRAPRTVRQTGKVLYAVTREEARPFEVLSDGGYIRVLGTTFQLDADKGEASCLSGKVLFAASRPETTAKDTGKTSAGPAEGQESWQVILTAGQRAALGDAAPSAVLNPAVWATGRFVYENAPLSAVLEELSEWSGVRLSFVRPSPNGMIPPAASGASGSRPASPASAASSAPDEPRLTATFEAGSLDEILSLIEAALDVKLLRLSVDRKKE